MTPTPAEREKAREIVAEAVRAYTPRPDYTCIPPALRDKIVALTAHALAAARAQALEEAAQWIAGEEIDGEADVFACTAKELADQFREHFNLKQPQEPGNG